MFPAEFSQSGGLSIHKAIHLGAMLIGAIVVENALNDKHLVYARGSSILKQSNGIERIKVEYSYEIGTDEVASSVTAMGAVHHNQLSRVAT